jgi:hypothetical protein
MGGLFKTPSVPGPDPKIAETQAKQEARIAEKEAATQRQIAASQRARRTGGLRLLFSQERENPMMGIATAMDELGTTTGRKT